MKEKAIKLKADRKSVAGLLPAAKKGKVEQLRALLDDGANIERKNNRGQTALVRASEFGRFECIQFLLDRGADANAGRKFCSLVYASMSGHVESVRLLLDHGAKIDTKSYYGLTPLMYACLSGQAACVALLLERGADTSLSTPGGLSATDYSTSAEILQLLLDASNKTDYVLK